MVARTFFKTHIENYVPQIYMCYWFRLQSLFGWGTECLLSNWAPALIAWYCSSFNTLVKSVWDHMPSLASWCPNNPIVPREPTTTAIVIMLHWGSLFPKSAGNSKYLALFCASLSISKGQATSMIQVLLVVLSNRIMSGRLAWIDRSVGMVTSIHIVPFCVSCTAVFASFTVSHTGDCFHQSSHNCIVSSFILSPLTLFTHALSFHHYSRLPCTTCYHLLTTLDSGIAWSLEFRPVLLL